MAAGAGRRVTHATPTAFQRTSWPCTGPAASSSVGTACPTLHPADRIGRLPAGRARSHGPVCRRPVLPLPQDAGFHCAGGYEATDFDLLSPLIDWMESTKAPGAITATGKEADNSSAYTRPVYPYAQQAAYSGQGDKDDAVSYVAHTPMAGRRTTGTQGRRAVPVRVQMGVRARTGCA
ncbi:tannase/feruloyl esterase family alpha/beta hydrolase [Streptomyces sp. NPDC059262]|uniref:tannase/feruloyl esterase family alpha/beta hydrolase n=1 Tax=Streptomyces sp. NPDC059262 TaxID=3346797 RepID=UPI00367DD0CE